MRIATWWLSSDAMTVTVTIDEQQTILSASPIIRRRFVGQPLANLMRWMRAQGGFRMERV